MAIFDLTYAVLEPKVSAVLTGTLSIAVLMQFASSQHAVLLRSIISSYLFIDQVSIVLLQVFPHTFGVYCSSRPTVVLSLTWVKNK